MGLKDLFDIALTTLAFLSFGMFILQVIMCVTMVVSGNFKQLVKVFIKIPHLQTKSSNTNSLVMMPMEEVDPGTPDVEEVGRSRRSLPSGSSLTQVIKGIYGSYNYTWMNFCKTIPTDQWDITQGIDVYWGGSGCWTRSWKMPASSAVW